MLNNLRKFYLRLTRPSREDPYARGYVEGRRDYRATGVPFWAHEHTLKPDAFDYGWDDGVRAEIQAKRRRMLSELNRVDAILGSAPNNIVSIARPAE